ncbi:Phosphatidic acid phosphohydrolase 2 isoform 1 [Hibiscus syriacus]|uniref:Phosphatidic acid phosphohydrolase 2 isoform 1 n=1 Tax=Hibiscus syriacus TaxID=106335 RepID=A0A6A3AR67_HIBSY|nr:Phosphatidic acid phosphohydrolase 2 isoform 1 [Hibiscus syriacus]
MDQRWEPKPAALPLSKGQLKALFRRFDGDRDGRLSKSELKKAFNEMGSRVAAFRALGALQHADDNGDKLISGDEFEDLLQYAVALGYTIKSK